MKVGLILPQGYFNEYEGWDPVTAMQRTLAVARLAERLGFESVWTGEHVLPKWGGDAIVFDCVALAAALAASVPRVGIGFIVINSTFRNPALTAKTAATIDVISGGRLTLGLGAGFKPTEAEAFGFDYPDTRERLAILAEHLEIVRAMVTADAGPVTFAGRYARVTEVLNSPRGAQRPRIPILMGGHGPNVTFRLAARFADELNIDLLPPDVPAALDVLRERCVEAGRDPATLRLSSGINPSIPYKGLRSTGGQHMMRPDEMAFMDPDRVAAVGTRAEELAAWRELGFDRVMCGVPGLANTDETLYELVDDCRLAGLELGSPSAA